MLRLCIPYIPSLKLVPLDAVSVSCWWNPISQSLSQLNQFQTLLKLSIQLTLPRRRDYYPPESNGPILLSMDTFQNPNGCFSLYLSFPFVCVV